MTLNQVGVLSGLAIVGLACIPLGVNGQMLQWSDEFNGSSVDLANWEFMNGDGTQFGLPAGWGNNELQYYTDRPQNVFVSGGMLHIVARAENFAGYGYTSTRMRSRNLQDFLYGRIEARIQLPSGQGIWPAFWMLPSLPTYGGWAASGEIDIMESVNVADVVFGTTHFGGQWPQNSSNGGTHRPGIDLSQGFHVYAIEWSPDEIRWYFDGLQYHQVTSAQWFSANAPSNPRAPFDLPFHLLLNVAVGGNFPGDPNGSNGFPMEMLVDWIRVFDLAAQAPFSGSPHVIPGRIEAEDYDTGGSTIAYSDADVGNNGGAYRTDDVDIQPATEGAFNIGWIDPGDWMEYTVNVSIAGTYDVQARVASLTTGGTFHLELDGSDFTGTLTAPVTSGWQTWQTISKTVPLTITGPGVLRFANDAGASQSYNLNWIDLNLLASQGDVNADTTVNVDDLYSLEASGGPFADVDLDGVNNTPADRAALIGMLRGNENADVTQ